MKFIAKILPYMVMPILIAFGVDVLKAWISFGSSVAGAPTPADSWAFYGSAGVVLLALFLGAYSAYEDLSQGKSYRFINN